MFTFDLIKFHNKYKNKQTITQSHLILINFSCIYVLYAHKTL